LGAVAAACADAGDAADSAGRSETTGTAGTADTRSADQLLDEADRTMKALTSVTVVTEVTMGRDRYFSSLTTDLKSRCRQKTTASMGSEMEQIRIGETDYIHGNDVYFENWGRETVPAMRQKPWLKSPVSAKKGADNLADCVWRFLPPSSGKATKADPNELDGEPVIPVVVPDEEIEGAVYTCFVAAEGKPYLLRVDHKERHAVRVTKFTALDDRLDIQPPPTADVLDLSTLPSADS
jgi:hypothetical protein